MSLQTGLTLGGAALVLLIIAVRAKYTFMKVTYYEADKSITVSSKYHNLTIATIYEESDMTIVDIPGAPSLCCGLGDGFPALDRAWNSLTYKSKRPCELRIIMRCTIRDQIIHAAKMQKRREMSQLPEP